MASEIKMQQNILAIDVSYSDTTAKVVALAFEAWSQGEPNHVYEIETSDFGPYLPGEFYKRELPCIEAILKQINLTTIRTIIVDGFVYLGNDLRLGLGGYLFYKLNETIPVIGVAKNNFHRPNNEVCREVLRGEITRPLYITAVGVSLNLAARKIESMHGNYRLPTLLRLLDVRTKSEIF